MSTEFVEGAWYWCSDGNKWKVKAVFPNLVLARRRYRFLPEAFFFGEDGNIHLEVKYFHHITIDPKWKVE